MNTLTENWCLTSKAHALARDAAERDCCSPEPARTGTILRRIHTALWGQTSCTEEPHMVNTLRKTSLATVNHGLYG